MFLLSGNGKYFFLPFCGWACVVWEVMRALRCVERWLDIVEVFLERLDGASEATDGGDRG